MVRIEAKRFIGGTSKARRSRSRAADICRVGIVAAILLAASWFTAAVASAVGLPDQRVYELVSPSEKPGSTAGADLAESPDYGRASEDGQAFLFEATGPLGQSNSGTQIDAVARRTDNGWISRDPLPREIGVQNTRDPESLDPSADLSEVAVTARGILTPESEFKGSVYLAGGDGSLSWLGRPSIANPNPGPGTNEIEPLPVLAGAASKLATVYFTYFGTLVPEDASRAPNVTSSGGPWGFYEWSGGKLVSAGELPDGSFSPFGAVPAATTREETIPGYFDNQVSEDGSYAYFVSPDPNTTGHPNERPELYVREPGANGHKKSVLISRSELTHQPATPGPAPVGSANSFVARSSYVFASPDGTRAFFASEDQLTSDAPADTSVKEYEYDVSANTLRYRPDMVGPLLGASHDGSRLIFEDTANTPATLEFWEVTAGGGEAMHTITQLPAPTEGLDAGTVNIPAVRATSNDSVFVFQTSSPIPGGFNNGGGFEQIYRYETDSRSVSCVSCPPAGMVPTGGTSTSNSFANGAHLSSNQYFQHHVLDDEGISSDGTRVFFDSPDPLVAQDVNGKRDVYEWEREGSGKCPQGDSAGCVSLISSGTSTSDSFILDSSPTGNDVFFSTVSGLIDEDTDGGYDVYDARVDGGFPEPEGPAACTSNCQGLASPPPSAPALLTSVSGPSGNLAAPLTKLSSKTKNKSAKKPAKHRKAKKKKHVKRRVKKSALKSKGIR